MDRGDEWLVLKCFGSIQCYFQPPCTFDTRWAHLCKLSKHVRVHVCACMHVCMRVCVHACVYMCVCTRACSCIHTRTHTHTCTHTHACTYVRTYIPRHRLTLEVGCEELQESTVSKNLSLSDSVCREDRTTDTVPWFPWGS